jgi:hypothetical protein
MLSYVDKCIKYSGVICVKYKTDFLPFDGVVYEDINIMKLESRPKLTRTFTSDPSPGNKICFFYLSNDYRPMGSRDSAVGIAAGYWLDG